MRRTHGQRAHSARLGINKDVRDGDMIANPVPALRVESLPAVHLHQQVPAMHRIDLQMTERLLTLVQNPEILMLETGRVVSRVIRAPLIGSSSKSIPSAFQ